MSEPVTSLRAWRYPTLTRRLVAGGLLVSAVITAVVGQSLLTGMVALAVLMFSASALSGAIVYLMLDFQGTCSMTTLTLLLPGGRDVALKRVVDAHAEGHELVLQLDRPAETLRIGTQQPPDEVAAFCRGVMQARGEQL